MKDIVYLTPHFAITGDLAPADFAAAASLGFKAILNNRPDGEEENQLSGAAEAEFAWQAGLKYRFLPLDKHELFTDPVVEGMINAMGELDGPILAHCKSGLRSAIVWAAASARSIPVDDVLAALDRAGQELDFLRDELDAQADRRHWMPDTIASQADVVTQTTRAGAANLAA
ncbi:MAG: TIGR01244 family sulfur transferase [Hyphomicrobiaceae bacterium]